MGKAHQSFFARGNVSDDEVSLSGLRQKIDNVFEVMGASMPSIMTDMLNQLKAGIQKVKEATGTDKHPWMNLACVLNDMPVLLSIAYMLETGDYRPAYLMAVNFIPAWNSLFLHTSLIEPKASLVMSWALYLPNLLFGYFQSGRSYLFGQPSASKHYFGLTAFCTYMANSEMKQRYAEAMENENSPLERSPLAILILEIQRMLIERRGEDLEVERELQFQ